MTQPKITIGGSEALFGAALLFAVTNVLVRMMADMWGDQAQVAVRFALVWLLLMAFAIFRKKSKNVFLDRTSYRRSPIVFSLQLLFFSLPFQYKEQVSPIHCSRLTLLNY